MSVLVRKRRDSSCFSRAKKMLPRKHQSGASKRKALKERDEFESKLTKLTSFFPRQTENVTASALGISQSEDIQDSTIKIDGKF